MIDVKNSTEIDLDRQDRIIRAAWEDDVSFDSIYLQFGLREDMVIRLMKKIMTPNMFIVWRKRVRGRLIKHAKRQKERDNTNLI